MIRYLIKFVSKKEYAEQLVKGELFTRPAGYYEELEFKEGVGQGDRCEGLISGVGQIKMRMDHPIFCLYSVTEDEIVEDTIKISTDLIDTFKCIDGYAVLIDFNKFENLLKSKEFTFNIRFGPVHYGYIPDELMSDFFSYKLESNLFIKVPRFSYQKEYRIEFVENLERSILRDVDLGEHSGNELYNGHIVDISSWNDVFKIYHLPRDLKDCTRILKIADLKEKDEYYIHLPEMDRDTEKIFLNLKG